ncbi:beta-ketoacyl synthase chain length factor [Orbaceae bacterium ESL0721]|nr:beta-ketoacyl synthase chain length factor [Orbaceae bacterium ESL0721]
MKFSLNISRWSAISPDLLNNDDWLEWSKNLSSNFFSQNTTLPKSSSIPMMTARRLSIGCRLALEVGLKLMQYDPCAAIFISRHGELERSYKILLALNQLQTISPTDFTMSVHNTAAGLLTIVGQKDIPTTSIAAGGDGFQQGIIEAQAMLQSGLKRVLLIDFEGIIPEFYHSFLKPHEISSPYAVGFIITSGDEYSCSYDVKNKSNLISQSSNILPQGLLFLKNYLLSNRQFYIKGSFQDWVWEKNGK